MEIKARIYKGNIILETKKNMPIIYYSEDYFRKGVEINFCDDCKDFKIIGCYEGKNKRCHDCDLLKLQEKAIEKRKELLKE